MNNPLRRILAEKDSCRSCPFNGVNRGLQVFAPRESENFFCDIRIFPIDSPDLSFCANHPVRNPLWSTRVRGPLWTAVHISLDSRPLSRKVRIPPELVPPQGAGHSFRIPFFGMTRPVQDGAAPCEICGAVAEETIRLTHENGDLRFCSAAHYFEWWLQHDPEAAAGCRRLPLELKTLRARLSRLPEALLNGMEEFRTGGGKWLMSGLEDLEILLQEIRFRRMAALYDALDREDAERALSHLQVEMSPTLQILQKQLSRVGEKLRSPEAEYDSLYPWVEKIIHSIGVLLKQLRGL